MKNHFELFQLPLMFEIDAQQLDAAYRELQSRVHPDKFVTATDAEKRVAMQWATRANEAYQTLKNPLKRAMYLCEMNGVDLGTESNTAMPVSFLMQQIEWREALDEARDTKNQTALEQLESELHQYVNTPTRDNNILDLVLSTGEDLVSDLKVGLEYSTSDHRLITFKVKMKNKALNSSKEKVPDFRRADFVKLRNLLANSDWNNMLTVRDINKSWEIFQGIFNGAVNQCVPFRNRRKQVNTKPKWWTNEISRNLTTKKRAHDRYVVTRDQNDRDEFCRVRRETKRLIRQSKRNLEEHIANSSKSNPKEFYSYVRNKKMLGSTIGPLATTDGNIVNEDTEMANILNDFFASVFTDEDPGDIKPFPARHNDDTYLNNIHITERDILQTVTKMNVNKTPGPDKISPRILKEVKEEISHPLFILFSESLRQGKVPTDWKYANVTPVFKKGVKSNPSNYRPISLTSVICKTLETLIRDKVVKFLEKNGLINNSQFGFRNKRSCLTNLLDFFNYVYNVYDDCRSVDIIYLDFQKAFDKVPHMRLLTKLKAHGVTGNIHKWIEDWLSKRKQRVVINGISSSWRGVKSGVPQGSVLGPVLFLIYVNDLDDGLTCKVSKFADDTKIASKVISTLDKEFLQRDLDKLSNWARDWQMKFNIEKCKVMHIGINNDNVKYLMNGVELLVTNTETDLGVMISDDLKPSNQCSKVVKTANKLVGFIGRTFEHKSEKVILTLYNSLVRPLLEYCIQFWSPYYRKDIDKLERVQRRVTKMIPRLRCKPYEQRLQELNLFSLSKRRMRGDLIEVFKMLKGFVNVDVNDYFTLAQSRITRGNGYKIASKRFASQEAKHFFFNRVVNAWNSLPASVVESESVVTFKNRLDEYLKSNSEIAYFSPA